MEIRKKIDKETALKTLEEIKEKILGQNVLSILESDNVQEEIKSVRPGEYLLAATMAGFVYYDDEKNCLVQELIKPVQSGEQTADKFYYKNHLSLELMREEQTSNEIALTINVIARLTGRTKQIIGKIYGQDSHIIQDIASFFFA
jgi:hypothetical protein|nr:MAG TPA: tail assembly chaperone protein [Caudoviricetes sp.]